MKLLIISLIFWLTCLQYLYPQHDPQTYVPVDDPVVLNKLEQWQDLKFGLLMHWGAYCQWGIVESWSICPEDYGWCERKMGNHANNYFEYVKEYENLKTTFNPTSFNPEKWAEAASAAGMKYVIFTTKHHDGFCMFDSQLTNYKVTDSLCPFAQDPRSNITLEIFDAFRKKGFWTGTYFSKPDWHHDNYWDPYFPPKDRNVNYDPEIYPEKWEEYVQFTHGQILELMQDYGKIDILWLDGGWVARYDTAEIQTWYDKHTGNVSSGFMKSSIVNQDIRMDELVMKAREKQPGLIVVDRAVYGKNQNYLTPENQVPEKALPYPWESCIIAGGGWSWTPQADYMSGRQAIQLLIDIVAKGGNLLLNIAPGPQGQWHQSAYRLLDEIGQWMEINKEAIYNSRAIPPYKEGNLCYTHNTENKTIYAFYLPENDKTEPTKMILLNRFEDYSIRGISLLGSKENLKWSQNDQYIQITLPEAVREDPKGSAAWVFKLTYK